MTLENDCGKCFIKWKIIKQHIIVYIFILIVPAFSNCNFGYGTGYFPANLSLSLTIGSLSKHDVDESENVIWKCNFAFL